MSQVGTMKCLVCDQEMPVKGNDKQTISVSCPWCDFSGYAKKGAQAHGLLLKKVKLAPAPEVKPAETKPVETKEAPAKPAKMPWMS